jgi:hypothetical protein
MSKQQKLTAAVDAAVPSPTTNNILVPYDEAAEGKAIVAEPANFANIDSDPLYIEAVKQAQAVAARMESDWWSLCKLADSIVAKYGNEKNKTLIKFAADIGAATVVPCTWERRLSVYRSFKDILPAPGPVPYAVLRELQDCPTDARAELIQKYPGMTKAQAREFAKNAKGEGNKTDRTPDAPEERNTKRWLREVLDAATAADDCAAQVVRLAGTRTASPADLSPELRAAMRAIVLEPDKLFQKLEDSAAALIDAGEEQKKFAEFVKQALSDEEDDEADLGEEDDPAAEREASYAAQEAEATAAPVA